MHYLIRIPGNRYRPRDTIGIYKHLKYVNTSLNASMAGNYNIWANIPVPVLILYNPLFLIRIPVNRYRPREAIAIYKQIKRINGAMAVWLVITVRGPNFQFPVAVASGQQSCVIIRHQNRFTDQ